MFPNLLKSKNLIFGSSIIVAASAIFLGCQVDPYIITAEEQYTRNFIKDFGLVDPDQDWNLAKDATVSVNLGAELCSSVKIYGKVNDTYYLVADLTDLSGTIEVPVDLPKSCNDIMVKAKGRKFYGNLGSTINCADMSRGVPNVTYDADGMAKNPNPALYTKTYDNGYGITVKHTDKGNGKGSSYAGQDKGNEYQYFNTQQISPLISTTPWDTYYSENTKKWTENQGNPKWVGLLPESGVFNRLKSELEGWMTKKRNEGHTMVEDFRITTGDDGSFTLFPYYYGTNLKHELGVYLLDKDGNPLLKNGTYDKNSVSTYTLDDFISFPVFQDRVPGDLQVQAHYDNQITGIRLRNGNPEFVLGEDFNLQSLVDIQRGNEGWMSYDEYIEKYGSQYHSRVAYHFWVDEPKYEPELSMIQNPDSFARIDNNGMVHPIKITEGHENGIAYANVAIANGLDRSMTSGAGIGRIYGVEQNFNYKVVKEGSKKSTIRSIDIAESELKIHAGGTKILKVTLKDKDGKILPLDEYINQISVTDGWDTDKCQITKDGNTIKLTYVGPGESWPRVYVTEFGTDGIYDYVHVQTTDHHITKEYTGASEAITLDHWQTYFESTSESKTNVTGELFTGDSKDQGTPATGVIAYGTIKLDKDIFKNVDNTYVLRIKMDSEHALGIRAGGWNPALSYEYKVGNSKYKSGGDDGCVTTEVSDEYYILLSDDVLEIIQAQGIAFQEKSGSPVEFKEVEVIRPARDHDWKANGKNDAAAELATYYTGKAGTKKCDDCPKEFDIFATITPSVTIFDDAGHDNIHYSVKWEQPHSAASVSKHRPSARSRSVSSREYNSSTTFLQPNGEWKDVNSFWSRFLPHQEEVASYPPNVCMLARSRGYDVKITYGTDEKGEPKPWVGNLGMYLKVLGSYDIVDPGNNQNYTEEYTPFTKGNSSKYKQEYVVFSQKRFNKGADGLASDQISALSVKHPMSGRTFLTFEDMRVTRNDVTPKDFYKEKSSDRDVNDLIFNITNYGGISNDKETITETDENEFSWLWAVEDLGATDDFDFNDMVMKITSVTKNKTVKVTDKDENGNEVSSSSTTTTLYKKVTFTPLCAGGTLPLYVNYKKADDIYILKPGSYKEASLNYTINDPLLKVEPSSIDDELKLSDKYDESSEIHRWFGNYPSTMMINTSKGGYIKAQSCVLYLNTDFTIEGFGISNSAQGRKGGLSVSVNDERAIQNWDQIYDKDWENTDGWVIKRPDGDGKVSQMFMIYNANKKWRWPVERIHMLMAYPTFKDWVQNRNNSEWFNSGNKECTVPRYDLGERE